MITKTLRGQITAPKGYVDLRTGQVLIPVRWEAPHYVREDGLSLGYTDDEGWFTVVHYESAVGALAEDTLALAEEYRELREEVKLQSPGGYALVSDFFETEMCERPGFDSENVIWVEALADFERTTGEVGASIGRDHAIYRIDGRLYFYSYSPSDSSTYWFEINFDPEFHDSDEAALAALDRRMKRDAEDRRKLAALNKEVSDNLAALAEVLAE